MDRADLLSPPQKRRASVSCGSSAKKKKHTRSVSVSISTKVSSGAAVDDIPSGVEGSTGMGNPQACLSGLPEELLVDIFKNFEMDPQFHLDSSDGRSTLRYLRRTSRHCKRIAEQVLYRVLHGSAPGEINAVANNIVLAKNVRYIEACSLSDPSMDERPANGQALRKVFSRVIRNAENLRGLNLNEHDSVPYGLESSSWTWFLRDISLSLSGSPPIRFANLERLTLSGSPGLNCLAPIFCIPSLRYLQLQECSQTTYVEAWPVPVSSCNIEKLYLTHCFMDTAVVSQILSVMRGLKSFEWSYSTDEWTPLGPEADHTTQWASFSWSQLGSALRQQMHSLVELDLKDYSDREIIALVYPDGRNLGTLGTLLDFSELKRISVSYEALLDPKADEDDVSMCLPKHVDFVELMLRSCDFVFSKKALLPIGLANFAKLTLAPCLGICSRERPFERAFP